MYKENNPEFDKKSLKNMDISNLQLSKKNMPELFSDKKLENYTLEKTIGRGMSHMHFSLSHHHF